MRIELCRAFREARVLAQALGCESGFAPKAGRIYGLTTDSREVLRGDVFVALQGKLHHGLGFVEQALERGAVGVIAPTGAPLPEGEYFRFFVKSPEKALLAAVAYRRAQLSGRVIVISGSTGKTTLKEGLSLILEEVGAVRKSGGNYNSTIGMPLSFLSMEAGDFYLLELGINHPGEMEPMSRALAPHVAALTNVGSAHIGNFGSFDALLTEKMKIAAGLADGGALLVPESLQLPREWCEKTAIYRVGAGMNCAFRAENIHMDENGVRLDLTDGKRRDPGLSWGVPGSIGVSFLSMAAGVAFLLGVPEAALVRGLARASAFTPRMRRVFAGNRLLLDDTYNASPEAVMGALEVLELVAGKRERVAVLGDILELGEFSAALHEAVGECIGKSRVDKLFTYGEAAAGIAKGARLSGMPNARIYSFFKGEEAELLSGLLGKTGREAAILFKASRGMRLERIVAEIERKA